MTKMIEVPEVHLLELKAWRWAHAVGDQINYATPIDAILACMPKPIEAGDRVRTVIGEGIVVAVDGDTAWVRRDDGVRLTWRIKNLEVIE